MFGVVVGDIQDNIFPIGYQVWAETVSICPSLGDLSVEFALHLSAGVGNLVRA